MVERAILVKFGQYQHICQLRDEGLLFMHNLPYFWQIEDEELRGDKFDGVAEVIRGHGGTATPQDAPENSGVVGIGKWEVRRHPPHPEKIHIFSMCAVRPSVGLSTVHSDSLRFGDYALVLLNPQDFIDRISSRLRSQDVTHKAGLVEYVADDYSGEFGPFRKLDKFAYQSEWRLVCYGGVCETRSLRIGDIGDISIALDGNHVNQKISELL